MNTRKIALFVALAYLGSWGLLGVFVLAGGRLDTPAGVVVAVAYMFVPMVAALVVHKGIYGERVRGPLGVSFRVNRWWVVAWLLPAALLVFVIGASGLMPGVAFDAGLDGLLDRWGEPVASPEREAMTEFAYLLPVHPIWLGLVLGLLAGATVNAVAGFGEELGWRGLLQHELAPAGFWPMAALIGVVWGVWHAPMILLGHNYPQNPVPGVFLMIAFAVLLSPVFSFIRIRSGSVVAAAILHGSLNGVAGLPILVLRGGSDLTIGITGAAGLAVLLLLNLLLYLRFRPGVRA